MALMFAATASIKKAVLLINELNSGIFPPLLSRILQKLHLKDERTFTEEEEEKLQSNFSLAASDLELVLQTLEFFLQQIAEQFTKTRRLKANITPAYHSAKPEVLAQQLQQLEIDEDKVNAIVEAWKNNAKDVVKNLRQRTVVSKQLEDIKWRLNLQIAQSTRTRMKIPNAMFEFGIKSECNETKEKIRLEFTHDELYTFYNQLETIQSQLDSLS